MPGPRSTVDGTMSDSLELIRPEIRALSAYSVADSAGVVKLDAMENPYRWPDAMRTEWARLLADEPINRYPEPSPTALIAAVRQWAEVPEGQGIVLGNGSDELIQMLLLAVRRERPVVAPVPTFVMYALSAVVCGHAFFGVPLDDHFNLDLAAVQEAVARHKPGLVFISYPNNPTGNLFDRQEIQAIIEGTDALVVVDEAYFPFARQTFLAELGHYPNLLVMRTLSKEGLAGLRFGFLAGPAEITAELEKIRLPYNINRVTQRSVEFASRHARVFQEQAARIVRDREILMAALAAVPGVRPWPSAANFILFQVPMADEVHASLRAHGVLVKNLSGGGLLPGFLRVTVGTETENARFLSALTQIVGAR